MPVNRTLSIERLNECVAARPAKFAGLGFDGCEHTPLDGQETQILIRGGMLSNFVDQTDPLERAKAFIVHPDAARIVDQIGAALEHDGRQSKTAELVCKRETDRSRTDDKYIDQRRGIIRRHCLRLICRQRPSP